LEQVATLEAKQEKGSMLDDVQAVLRRVLDWVRGGGLVRVSRHELFIPAVVGLIGLSLMFWPLYRQVYKMWNEDDNYSHIILVPFLIIWQLHRRRDMFVESARKSAPMVLVLLAPLAYFQYIAFIGDWWAMQSICFIAAVFGVVWTLFGGTWESAIPDPIHSVHAPNRELVPRCEHQRTSDCFYDCSRETFGAYGIQPNSTRSDVDSIEFLCFEHRSALFRA
jgi:hypothetical protein